MLGKDRGLPWTLPDVLSSLRNGFETTMARRHLLVTMMMCPHPLLPRQAPLVAAQPLPGIRPSRHTIPIRLPTRTWWSISAKHLTGKFRLV